MVTPNYSRRGLIKLMLRMPALRGQLQILAAQDGHFLDLCGAFEEASETLEALKAKHRDRSDASVAEYERICAEIEDEIILICYHKSRFDSTHH
jgi:hypothetical protein